MNHETFPAILNQAGSLLQSGAYEQALSLCQTILSETPGHPLALQMSATALFQLQQFGEAAILLDRLLSIQPANAEAWLLLAMTCEAMNDASSAISHYRQGLKFRPGWPEAGNRLGSLLRRTKRLEEAIACYESILAEHPEDPNTLFNLAIAMHAAFRFSAAESCLQKILARFPNDADTWLGLGNVLKDAGRVALARDAYSRALQLNPKAIEAGSNLLFVESYHCLCPPEVLLKHHQGWARRFAPVTLARGFDFSDRGGSNRPLRIGYVSPDLRRHPVATFFEGLLTAHDSDCFEIYCYAESQHEDAVSRRLKSACKGWFQTLGQSDEAVAEQVVRDRIDILVDLAGHTRGHRLKVFAMKPAPIQVSYLGYCTSTGLDAMDYWLTDRVLVPEDSPEQTSERIFRMSRCWVSYTPSIMTEPEARPRHERPLTFGCFNDLSKVSDECITL